LAWGEPCRDVRLRECHFGDIEGCTYDEADADYGDVFRAFRGFSTPGGESHQQLHERVRDFIEGLETGRHLLFAHGGVIRVLTQDLGVDRFLPTGSVFGLDWRNQKVLFVHEPGNSDRAD